MPSHYAKELATAVTRARGKKKKFRVHGLKRPTAVARARQLDQQLSPGARGNKHRFQQMVEKARDPSATISQIETILRKLGKEFD